MDTQRSLGLGLQSDVSLMPDVTLSTAPASPTDDMPHRNPGLSKQGERRRVTSTTHASIPDNSTVSQLSFAPATQQTVTTVTTTTTVTLPPLVIKPPRDLLTRDLKQYPLAYSPTPEYLKKFCTDVHGRPVRFFEEEDAQETMRKYRELQSRIQDGNGSLRSETKAEYATPVRPLPHATTEVHNVRASTAPKRATPPSIADAAELASLQRKIKKPRSLLHRTHSEMSEMPSLHQRAASGVFPATSNLSPVTPDPDAGNMGMLPPRIKLGTHDGGRKNSPTRMQSRLRDTQDSSQDDVQMADNESLGEDTRLAPHGYRSRARRDREFADRNAFSGATPLAREVATPPIAETDLDPVPISQPEERHRPYLPNILTGAQQDASLPSPSLSPITAAANLASRQNMFDSSFGEQVAEDDSTVSGLDLEDDSKTQSAESVGSQAKAPHFHFTHGSQQSQALASGPTIMDIPTMVDAFDSMPEAMQTYLIYQFLRRCAKPTLQMVANVVNPALKCDPFNVLPAELGLNITRFLDAQSMCRAAQVSKRWRRLINSDERAWKDLLIRDNFVLPDGEITRAIREGWGWQNPGEDGCEMDLVHKAVPGQLPIVPPSSPSGKSVVDDDMESTPSTIATRLKRKSVAKSSNSRKLKRRSVNVSATLTKVGTISTPVDRLNRLVHSAQGPNCLANAATQAVPNPPVGLPSLRNMHLFKSLYQRHYLIRKAWMKEESKPLHLAFRAHHRHVVTCLLFDGDKILTGSDDTKINVYDTKTGALKNRFEGHEGGVWALQYDGDTLVSGSTDRTVRVWDIQTGRPLQTLHGHTSTVRCLVILKPVQVGTNPNGTPIMMPKEPLIITGSRDSTLRIWKLPKHDDPEIVQAGPSPNDRDNPYFLRTLTGHHNSVRAIAAYGDTLISGSYDCTIRVWKISNGDLLHRLQGHTQKVYSVVLDHARERCISGSMDNLVKVWDLRTGSCVFNLEGHTSLVGLLDLSHDRLVSAAADSTLRIWEPESGACKATLSAHTGAITCFQHDGHKVISGSDRTLKMWNVRTGECVKDLLTDLSGVWQVRFDDRRCVAAVQRNNLTYIEVLDFGAWRDGVPDYERGRRIVVDCRGRETDDVEPAAAVEPEVQAQVS